MDYTGTIKCVAKKHGFVLKQEQETAILSILDSNSTFVQLPTGFGKSLIFLLLPRIQQELKSEYRTVLIACPLVSLIDSHKMSMERLGMSCYIMGQEGQRQNNYDFVISTPEALLNHANREWLRDLKICCFVADEVHTIPKWGYGETKNTKAFRKAFSKLCEIKSFLPPKTPLLAMTATATTSSRVQIMKSLQMNDVKLIYQPPVRSNIYFSVQKVNDMEVAFNSLAEELKTRGIHMEKTIVYCRTVVECATIFMYFMYILGERAYVDNNRLFAMYHYSSLGRIKQSVLQSLMEHDGTVRVVFATNSLGMGVDIPNVRYVYHFGAPRDMESYTQEFGRAGRDHLPSNAVLFYTGVHLRNIDSTMKSYIINTSECRQKEILKPYGDIGHQTTPMHNCCDVCANKCTCNPNCKDEKKMPIVVNSAPLVPSLFRSVNKEDEDDLRNALKELQIRTMRKNISFHSMNFNASLSDECIEDVISHAKYIFSLDYIMSNIEIYHPTHGLLILSAIHEIFEDIDAQMDFEKVIHEFSEEFGHDFDPQTSFPLSFSDSESDE